jgi:hypothetical protein
VLLAAVAGLADGKNCAEAQKLKSSNTNDTIQAFFIVGPDFARYLPTPIVTVSSLSSP